MIAYRLATIACLALAMLVAPAHAIVKEEYEDPIERCKRRCEERYDREANQCSKKRTRKEREKCYREAMERRAHCVRDCENLRD